MGAPVVRWDGAGDQLLAGPALPAGDEHGAVRLADARHAREQTADGSLTPTMRFEPPALCASARSGAPPGELPFVDGVSGAQEDLLRLESLVMKSKAPSFIASTAASMVPYPVIKMTRLRGSSAGRAQHLEAVEISI